MRAAPLLLAALLLSGSAAGAQWASFYGGEGEQSFNAVRESPGGGYLAVGWNGSHPRGTLVVRLRSDGRVKWARVVNGTERLLSSSAIEATSDGGYLVAGGDSGGVGVTSDGWLMKLDGGGRVLWQKRYGGSSGDFLADVCETPDGGFLAAGTTGVPYASNGWLVRVDGDGELLWERTYDGIGNWDDGFFSIARTAGDEYLLAGYSSSSFGGFYRDAWLLLVDAAGEVLWHRTYGGSGDEFAYDARPTRDGGYVFVGSTTSEGAGMSDGWIVKLRGSGAPAWQRRAGGRYWDAFTSVQEMDAGGFAVSGVLEDDWASANRAWLVGVTAKGKGSWQYTYGERTDLPYVLETGDGGLLLCTGTRAGGSSDYDAGLFRLDATGAIESGCPLIRKVKKAKLARARGRARASAAVTRTLPPRRVSSSPITVKRVKVERERVCG